MPDLPEYEHFKLRMSAKTAEKMDDDLILLDDVKQVLDYARQTGNNVVILENGHLLAHLRIGLITYWVEYQEEEDGYEVVNTYSHRMQIVEEVKADV
jgi:hypothetical protein